jgi:hypothetical protein
MLAQSIRNKRWRDKNRDKVNDWSREYYKITREKKLKLAKKWHMENPEKSRMANERCKSKRFQFQLQALTNASEQLKKGTIAQ